MAKREFSCIGQIRSGRILSMTHTVGLTGQKATSTATSLASSSTCRAPLKMPNQAPCPRFPNGAIFPAKGRSPLVAGSTTTTYSTRRNSDRQAPESRGPESRGQEPKTFVARLRRSNNLTYDVEQSGEVNSLLNSPSRVAVVIVCCDGSMWLRSPPRPEVGTAGTRNKAQASARGWDHR
jgi:hypothetical protein